MNTEPLNKNRQNNFSRFETVGEVGKHKEASNLIVLNATNRTVRKIKGKKNTGVIQKLP